MAKVRCLVSQRLDRCDRCINNDTECIFSQPRRARIRNHPYPRRPRRDLVAEDHYQEPEQNHIPPQHLTSPSQSASNDDTISGLPPLTPASHEDPITENSHQEQQHHQIQQQQQEQPVITNEIRARIIATLATLKGKRGAPFSFVTSGDKHSFGARTGAEESAHHAPQLQQQLPGQAQSIPSLKLSWLLRPLRIDSRHSANDDDNSRQSATTVKMPSYLSSMTLGHTVADPIESGILSQEASVSLFDHFMLEMNAKWEYVLDPHVDTHDGVRQRSAFLFASILFCSSKFSNYVDGQLVSATDPFLQIRLCSLARNLAIKTLAEGNRSIETMQAFYLLVCWKDADDDISYLHSGYAFRILHDLDLEQSDSDWRQAARRKRTWLALFRQDRQQSLFFVRRASLTLSDEESPFVGDLDTWLKMPYALPLDFVACCSADLRRLQSKLRTMVQKATSIMLPCLLELMDSELSRWRSMWQDHLEGEGRWRSNDDPSLNQGLLYPGRPHLNRLIGLWEHSVRLNVSSAILRQALMASVTSSRGLDISAIEQALSPDIPGLSSSIEGAFNTLRYLLKFPPDDLRRAPDAVLLLAPNSALFLCLLLCLPRNSILGPAFQKTAVSLIQDIARHIRQSVRSQQDTIALNSVYLDSLVNLLDPFTPHGSSNMEEVVVPSALELSHLNLQAGDLDLDDTTLQAAQVLSGGLGGFNCSAADTDAMFGLTNDPRQNLHIQSLANLLNGGFYWETPPVE